MVEGIEIDEDGNRIVRNKDGQIISRQKQSCRSATEYYTGTWQGIEVYTHISFVVSIISFIAFECLVNFAGGKMLVYAVIYAIMWFFSCGCHELCVAFMARRHGQEIDRILIWPLGGLGVTGLCKNPGHDIYVALAGPGSHAPFVVVFGALAYWKKSTQHVTMSSLTIEDNFSLYLLLGLLAMHSLLLAFNLLVPVHPLNASRVFMNLMAVKGVPVRKAAVYSVVIAGVLVTAQGCWIIYQWAEHNGGHARFLSLIAFFWTVKQCITLYTTKNENNLRQLAVFKPYESWQARMADAAASAPDAVNSDPTDEAPQETKKERAARLKAEKAAAKKAKADAKAKPTNTASAAPAVTPPVPAAQPSSFADNDMFGAGDPFSAGNGDVQDEAPLDLSNPFA